MTESGSSELVVTGIVRAESVIAARLAPVLRAHGITPAGFNVLMILDGADAPLCPDDISRRRLVSQGTTTGVLDSLERDGNLERRPHPNDRRRLLVALTTAGRRLLGEVLPEVRRAEAELTGQLDADEQAQLVALLGRVGRVGVAASDSGSRR